MYSAMREQEVKEQKALQLQVPDFAGEQMLYHTVAYPIGSMYDIFAYKTGSFLVGIHVYR